MIGFAANASISTTIIEKIVEFVTKRRKQNIYYKLYDKYIIGY